MSCMLTQKKHSSLRIRMAGKHLDGELQSKTLQRHTDPEGSCWIEPLLIRQIALKTLTIFKEVLNGCILKNNSSQ